MNYKLCISYKDFNNQLQKFVDDCKDILENTDINVKEMNEFSNTITGSIKNFLNTSVDSQTDDEFVYLFTYSSQSIFYDFLYSKDETRATAEKKIYQIISKVKYVKDIGSLIDSFVDPEKDTPIIETLTEKKDFILSKIYKVFNDNFYSVSDILKFNGISFRDKETEELAEYLKKRDYVFMENEYSGDRIKLTIKGASYIERKLKAKIVKKSTRFDSVDSKLDEITKRLKALGFGQQIIFEELEELRELQTKLSKKTWTQTLKGKLVDLGIDQVINKETAFMIYEFLTNDKLKLM